jgi:hypothetical protein
MEDEIGKNQRKWQRALKGVIFTVWCYSGVKQGDKVHESWLSDKAV